MSIAGVILVEGAAEDVQEYVARLRALQWKAMQVCGLVGLLSICLLNLAASQCVAGLIQREGNTVR